MRNLPLSYITLVDQTSFFLSLFSLFYFPTNTRAYCRRIDALCIIQDDEEDWARETSRMRDIYGNAVLTIAANTAKDPSCSLLGSCNIRASAHQTRLIVTQGPAEMTLSGVYARRRSRLPSHTDTAPHSSVGNLVDQLGARSWALQESILPTRILHFYNEEIVWSCFSVQRYECRILSSAAAPRNPFRKLLSEDGNPHPASLLQVWTKSVQVVTQRKLTVATDRLPAVSGLARFVRDHLDSGYQAGMWCVDLPYSLLWRSDHEAALKRGEMIERLPTFPYAPSYSWASVLGPVKYIPRHLDQFSYRRSGKDEVIPILRVSAGTANPMTVNEFGPAENCFVAAIGQILPVEFDVEANTWKLMGGSNDEAGDFEAAVAAFGAALDAENVLPPTFSPEGGIEAGIGAGTGAAEAARETQVGVVEPTFIFDVLEESPAVSPDVLAGGESYALLRAGRYIWKGTWSTASTEVVAIILVKLGTSPEGLGVYARRGLALHAFHVEKDWGSVPVETILIC